MSDKINNIFYSDGLFVKYPYVEFEQEEFNILFNSNREQKYTLDLFCPFCEKESVFSPIPQEDNYIYEQTHRNSMLGSDHPFSLRDSERGKEHWLSRLNIIIREFECSRNKTSHQHNFVVVFKFYDNHFLKIAQSPPVADLTNTQLRKYKKLSNDIFLELSKGRGLFSHGIGVGSFVYLRRIIENYIVKPELNKLGTQHEITPEELSKKDFKEKLNLLKGEISDFLVENKKIYSILSKGIHELTEDECKTKYPVVEKCIEMILDEQIELKEKAKKKEELAKQLNELS
ncbi:hypothetical protein GCM10007415_31480 [Parapedobacter pyrenivorans]|uniref:Uncharacterized protein n=1 Tax=Parapedobacter pyrenivorans TaxID=1305674 RepID=A0A917HWJ0_9SPHI|nr:hypothetical protein [Parapedobacter pyrenivorans]GGG94131.1 hypothetical protein GCM10007415_31480 [Parapedobacter pyrenivorans]